MKASILHDKRILAVDDEPDVLAVLEEEIATGCPGCTFDKATSYEQAAQSMASSSYDLVILDIMGVRGFDLLEIAATKKIPAIMLTAHALTPEDLKRSMELGARAYLPKEKLGEIVPFLEDAISYEYLPGWKRFLTRLESTFNNLWGSQWKKSEERFWKEFDEKSAHIRW